MTKKNEFSQSTNDLWCTVFWKDNLNLRILQRIFVANWSNFRGSWDHSIFHSQLHCLLCNYAATKNWDDRFGSMNQKYSSPQHFSGFMSFKLQRFFGIKKGFTFLCKLGG